MQRNSHYTIDLDGESQSVPQVGSSASALGGYEDEHSDNGANNAHHVWGQLEISSSNGSDGSFNGLPQRLEANGTGSALQRKGDGYLAGVTFLDSPSSSSEEPGEASESQANGSAREDAQQSVGHSSFEPIEVAKRSSTLAAKNMSRMASGIIADSGQWSKGSVLHAEGKCKPCAWSWKPNGCSKGADCLFCHTCDEDAHKQYKVDKLAGLKENLKLSKLRKQQRRG